MRTLFVLCTAMGILLARGVVAAHVQAGGSVEGYVTDAESMLPLEGVHVFIERSTRGTATDANGYFRLAVPIGTHRLVASMLGYETQMKAFAVADTSTHHITFRLAPTVLELAPVLVTGEHPAEWRRHLRRFEEELLGTSRNARHCTLLNPEHLSFTVEGDRLLARSEVPLQIENKALGYRIYYLMEDFFVDLDSQFMGNVGMLRFELLTPTNEEEAKRWERERERAYNGSLRHFTTALIAERLELEGFELYGKPDSSLNTREIYRIKEADEVLEPAFPDGTYALRFEGDLVVKYKDEIEETNYLFEINKTESRNQQSLLQLHDDPVVIKRSGHLENPYAVTKYGYWGWERFAEMLPSDYVPRR